MFWILKSFFSGDSDFTVSNYYNLPYQYVLDAYDFSLKQKQRILHENEAPTSLLCSLIANTNRDPKKNKKPYTMNDFYLYEPQEDQNIPMYVYGAAAMELIRRGLFPKWGLFVYKDLKQSADGEPPDLLAFISEGAILLAPRVKNDSVKGMLICEDKTFNKQIKMESPCGQSLIVTVPSFDGRYVAIEDIELEIVKNQ